MESCEFKSLHTCDASCAQPLPAEFWLREKMLRAQHILLTRALSRIVRHLQTKAYMATQATESFEDGPRAEFAELKVGRCLSPVPVPSLT